MQTPEDIVSIDGLQRVPLVLYDNHMDFSRLPIDRKKQKFIDLMLPSILAVKYNYDIRFNKVDRILRKLHEQGFVDHEDSVYLIAETADFNARNWWDLRKRLKTHPVSIVIAQAAVESGWGSSRFFRTANNVFGIWSFDSDENRIQSGAARGNQSVFLRAYPNVAASIKDYFDVLSSGRAYRKFRNARTNTSDPLALIPHLQNYSELRSGYIRKLRTIITQNSLSKYDSSSLSKAYTTGKDQLYF
ncbi:MAG: glucosaminidase domain-containing protein [Cyclobacteriaceae bacterium]